MADKTPSIRLCEPIPGVSMHGMPSDVGAGTASVSASCTAIPVPDKLGLLHVLYNSARCQRNMQNQSIRDPA